MTIRILVCTGILAVMASLQLFENALRGIDTSNQQLTPVGWLKFMFSLFLLWKWVGTFCI